ncbi:hypothetical protein Trydic_g15804 [Trypoxylus dichotomus]
MEWLASFPDNKPCYVRPCIVVEEQYLRDNALTLKPWSILNLIEEVAVVGGVKTATFVYHGVADMRVWLYNGEASKAELVWIAVGKHVHHLEVPQCSYFKVKIDETHLKIIVSVVNSANIQQSE